MGFTSPNFEFLNFFFRFKNTFSIGNREKFELKQNPTGSIHYCQFQMYYGLWKYYFQVVFLNLSGKMIQIGFRGTGRLTILLSGIILQTFFLLVDLQFEVLGRLSSPFEYQNKGALLHGSDPGAVRVSADKTLLTLYLPL